MKLVLLGAALVLGRQSAGGAEPGFGLAGNEHILWAYQRHIGGVGGYDSRIVLAYRKAGAAEFLALPLEIDGDVRRVAIGGQDALSVFYVDGAHWDYGESGVSLGRNLPEQSLPLALCGDDRTGTLYAVVRASVAAKLAAQSESRPSAASSPAGDNGAGAGRLPVVPELRASESMHATGTSLVRLELAGWACMRELPAEATLEGPIWIAARDGTVVCLFAAGREAPIFWSRTLEAGWSELERVTGVRASDVVAVLAEAALERGGRAVGRDVTATVVAFGAQQGEHGEERLVRFLRPHAKPGGSWTASMPLEGLGGTSANATDRLAAARFGDSLAVARLDNRGVVTVGQWPLNGGAPIVAPAVVDALRPAPQPALGRLTRLLITGTVLFAILAGVFAWRRPSIADAPQLTPGQSPAGLARRLAAFCLDLLIASPLIYVALLPWVAEMRATREWPDRNAFDSWLGAHPGAWLAATAVFAAYAAIFEAAIAATPGKRLLGCRIVDRRGGRCRVGRIAVRNLARLLEFYPPFHFLPIAVPMVLTRSRQRLGDLIAGTMVVEGAAVQTPPAEKQ